MFFNFLDQFETDTVSLDLVLPFLLVLLLFGILPAAMSWSDRYSSPSPSLKLPQLVPGGRVTLSLIIGGSGFVIFSELLGKFGHS